MVFVYRTNQRKVAWGLGEPGEQHQSRQEDAEQEAMPQT